MHALVSPTASLFLESLQFIGRNGQIPGAPHLPTLVHLTLETLKIAAIGVALALVIALPIGIWLGHVHRGCPEARRTLR